MQCPHCQNEDDSMIEFLYQIKDIKTYFCGVCSKFFQIKEKE